MTVVHHPFARILVGYDGTANGLDALRLAAELAGPGATEVVVAAVYDPAVETVDMVEDRTREGRALLPRRVGADAAYAAAAPAVGLRELAAAEDADLLVVGATHRSTFVRATVGGVGEHLLHGAPCPVAVAPAGYAQDPVDDIGVIAVAFDGSRESEDALELATALAHDAQARIRLIGVVEPLPLVTGGFAAAANYAELEAEARDALRAKLEDAADRLPVKLAPEVALGSGRAAEQIIERLGSASVLVTGSRGHGALRRVLVGSVAASLAHSAPVPLIIAPRGAAHPGARERLTALP